MRGKLVIVRNFRGDALVRRVWDADANAVYITDDQQFTRLVAGHEALLPVGFPREDVFECDPGVAEPMSKGSIDWTRLEPYKGGRDA